MIHHQHHGEKPCLHCENAALKAEAKRRGASMGYDGDECPACALLPSPAEPTHG